MSPNKHTEDRWFIERVVLWLVMELTPHTVEHIRACTCNGLTNDKDGDCYFVRGDDKSPVGKTWGELFEETLPSRCNVREITEQMNQIE